MGSTFSPIPIYNVGGGMDEDDLINFILMHPSPSQKWRKSTIAWEWFCIYKNKMKGFMIYKCEKNNAIVSLKLLYMETAKSIEFYFQIGYLLV